MVDTSEGHNPARAGVQRMQITESIRLEKSFKLMEFKCSHSTGPAGCTLASLGRGSVGLARVEAHAVACRDMLSCVSSSLQAPCPFGGDVSCAILKQQVISSGIRVSFGRCSSVRALRPVAG